MLVPSPGSRHCLRYRHLVTSSAALRASSTCLATPTPTPYPAGSRRVLTTRHDPRPWRWRSLRCLSAFERHLATALDDYQPLADVPFQNLPAAAAPTTTTAAAAATAAATTAANPLYASSHRAPTAAAAPPPLYELRPFDVSSPLVVREPAARPPRVRISAQGIPGDVDEMLCVFDACLQVGKLERAALVLDRFAKTGALAPPDLVRLHNRYLRARLRQIQASPGLDRAEDLHQWYELRIRNRHLPPTAETVACMLKASLLTAHGARLERLVHRYMGMLSGDAGLEVLYVADVLSDRDLATITRICHTYNLLPDDLAASLSSSAAGSDAAAAAAAAADATDATPTHTTATPSTAAATAPAPAAATPPSPQQTAAAAVPEVRSTPQKGMGLKMLRRTLSLFAEIPEGRDIARLPYDQRREIQARLERDCVDAAVERWREENQALRKMGLPAGLAHPSLSARLYDWQAALEARLRRELADVDRAEAAARKSAADLDRCLYGPLLRQADPRRLAAVTILSTLSSLSIYGADRGVPLIKLVNQLAKVLEEEIRAQRRAAEHKSKARRRAPPGPAAAGRLPPDQPPEAAASDPLADRPWPLTIRTKVGALLLSALIETAKIDVVKEDPGVRDGHGSGGGGTLISQVQPAFSHANHLRRGKKFGMLVPNRALVDLMKREPRADLLARHLPMVVEPEPWSRFDRGGFVEYPASLVRVKHGERDQKIYAEAALARGDMDQVLRGLDVLGRTAWRINRPVFDVLLAAWNTGDAIAAIPPLHPDVPVPPEPDATADPSRRRAWIRAVKAAENEKSGCHSVRCFMNFQLEIARAFRDQTFYFPHNIDFRGRAYPIPTYLNHMGADHVRGLLRFARGKELGESGLRWLKVHLANVFGYDKASLRDREAFAMRHLDDITDSAADPLGGRRWWLQAEDPWQCLAACFELRAALDLPDPARYVSHLPVHQDGTCNGLQHYAALGGDAWGARQVNLEPGDRPADVYSAVAELVREGIDADAEAGNPYARALRGRITRKVVKQTVMTNVYGVTFAGARKQVLKQLDALYPRLAAESGAEPMVLASYVATKIFKALSTMFRGAHDIQYWLGEIGGRVCRALSPEQIETIAAADAAEEKAGEGGTRRKTKKTKKTKASSASAPTDKTLLSQFQTTLVWTTPLRMPVVQPYRKSGTRIVQTCLQSLILTTPDLSDPVHRRKQLQAFPPNFIHSLDASHMLLSALQCDEQGLTFAAVHDSFWTHAADVDRMNDVIRESFIRIHSEDVIGRLAAEFEARYRGSLYLAAVPKGSPADRKIAEFRRREQTTLRQELLLEKRRQDLLRSRDPDEVARGRAMVTPASLFEETAAAGGRDLLLGEAEEEMRDTGLGRIPAQERKVADALEAQGASSDAVSAAEVCAAAEGEEETTPGPCVASGLAEEDTAAAAIEDDDLGAQNEEDVDDDDDEGGLRSLPEGHFAVQISRHRQQKTKKTKNVTHIWLPFSLPAIPEKGDFDVRRLRASKYFFS